MNKKLITIGLVNLLFLGLIYSYGGAFAGFGKRGEGFQQFISSLSPEQRTKIQDLRRKFEDETAQLRGSMLTKRLELQSLWRNPKVEEKAIREKEKELRELQNQWRDKMVEYRLEVRKILTPDQLFYFGYGMKGPGMRFGRDYGLRHHFRGF